jgi:hypothetical protein
MEDLKANIEKEATRAAQLSREAVKALSARDFTVGKALMK